MQSHIIIKIDFKCIIGLLEFERLEKQKISLEIDAKADSFLDYAKVAKLSKKYLKEKKFYTLEKANKKLAKKIKNKFPQLKKIKIKIKKLEIMKNATLGAKYKKKY
ncbi:dihydroneopterin aldolase [Campylobacter sp. Cr9]|uniref:dihydroneopterin aldolase n=1 Tax=Campylobacter sp. Cr9 TaxID=2735728 RepID=UPI0030153705|nr:dihydroneopterin aldolase [Campylobacter sp. Cr9]